MLLMLLMLQIFLMLLMLLDILCALWTPSWRTPPPSPTFSQRDDRLQGVVRCILTRAFVCLADDPAVHVYACSVDNSEVKSILLAGNAAQCLLTGLHVGLFSIKVSWYNILSLVQKRIYSDLEYKLPLNNDIQEL